MLHGRWGYYAPEIAASRRSQPSSPNLTISITAKRFFGILGQSFLTERAGPDGYVFFELIGNL